MQANYQKSLARVLVHEGGYSNHPADPGGATQHGVTQRVYDAFRGRQGKPPAPVRYITDGEVNAIYRRQYWDAVQGDSLPPGVDYAVFDGAVNSGPAQSIKWLQRALGVDADGQLGERTLAAVRNANARDLIDGICDKRLAFMKSLKTWPVFGKGWKARVDEVRVAGKSMAIGGPTKMIAESDTPAQKADPADAKPKPSTTAASGTVGAGVATTAIAGAVKQAQDTIAPLADGNSTLTYIVAGMALVGVLVAVGGVVWHVWQSRKAAALDESLGR